MGHASQKSPLLAAANPFVFGVFTVYEGKGCIYISAGGGLQQYFMDVCKEDVVGTCYGCYFMEVASYYTRENLDGGAAAQSSVRVACLHSQNEKLDNELVRCVFEMKAMAIKWRIPLQT